MELPVGTKGRNATHDFFSLCSSSSSHAQQDPASPRGGYLKTHDFLQPLERDGKHATTAKEENQCEMAAVKKPAVPGPAASMEHLLPGGIGTYSISHLNQRALQPEGSLFATAQASSTTRNDENSNCSSYSGSGFTLWDESALKKGKTGKENIAAERQVLREAGENVVGEKWTSLLKKPSQSSSNHKHNPTTFGSFSPSQPSSSQKNRSFMDMITSAKNEQEEDDEEEEEEEEEDKFIIKKEPSSHMKGNLSVKVEAKTTDQKPNTPRSKHSATEQRRRSKINDRFQKLREIIPNSDQKRDKASFLLEVIEYIQLLQEKVDRYESSYNDWSHEPSKMMQWRNCHVAEHFIDHTQGAKTESSPASLVAAKFDENKAGVSPTIPTSGPNFIDSDNSTASTVKERGQQTELTSKAARFDPTMQPNILTFGRTSMAVSPVSTEQAHDTDKTTTWPPSQFHQNRSPAADCLGSGNKTKDQELTVEGGTINLSSVYSQGLLNTLTQALHTAGVDMSQARISVQIDLGKRAYGIPHSSTSPAKGDGIPSALPRSRAASAGEDFHHALKRLRTS